MYPNPQTTCSLTLLKWVNDPIMLGNDPIFKGHGDSRNSLHNLGSNSFFKGQFLKVQVSTALSPAKAGRFTLERDSNRKNGPSKFQEWVSASSRAGNPIPQTSFLAKEALGLMAPTAR